MFNFDKNMIPFAITLTLMTVLFIFGMIAFLIIIKTRQNRKSKQYMQALIDDRERTMYSISLEVHDNLTQMLTIARMTLRLIQDGTHPDKDTAMTEVNNILNTLIMDTHNISHALNPDYLKRKGLVASLEEEAQWVNASKKLDCKLTIEGEACRMDTQAELMAFRIAQEAIHNTIKYAAATRIEIKLSYTGTSFIMLVADDGIGFDTGTNAVAEGIGMSSMRQRARIVGGEVEIDSTPDKGTSVILNIPDLSKT